MTFNFVNLLCDIILLDFYSTVKDHLLRNFINPSWHIWSFTQPFLHKLNKSFFFSIWISFQLFSKIKIIFQEYYLFSLWSNEPRKHANFDNIIKSNLFNWSALKLKLYHLMTNTRKNILVNPTGIAKENSEFDRMSHLISTLLLTHLAIPFQFLKSFSLNPISNSLGCEKTLTGFTHGLSSWWKHWKIHKNKIIS